jgi:hypothetical protein
MRRPARELRRAIDGMPVETRQAMLDVIGRNPIVVGAYATDGGVCPMLAAHRNGGRTDYAAFARAWDRYCGARKNHARRATERELNALRTMLETSIADDAVKGAGALERAIADHRRAQCARARREELEPLARTDELDLGDDAARRGLQHVADRLGDVRGLDHLLGGDAALHPVGHRRVDEAGAERRRLDAVVR